MTKISDESYYPIKIRICSTEEIKIVRTPEEFPRGVGCVEILGTNVNETQTEDSLDGPRR